MRTNGVSLVMLGTLAVLLAGCDAVVAIRGEITSADGAPVEDCTATLFRARNGYELEEIDIERVFDDLFVTGPTHTDFFVELTCEGYSTYRSPPFHSTGVLGDPPAELGEIQLEPVTPPEH